MSEAAHERDERAFVGGQVPDLGSVEAHGHRVGVVRVVGLGREAECDAGFEPVEDERPVPMLEAGEVEGREMA